MAIRGKCHRCGDQEFRVESDSIFRLAVPWLSSLLQREVEYACAACGEVRQWSSTLFNLGDGHRSISLRPPSDVDVVKNKHSQVAHRTPGREFISIGYPAVFREGENVLFPTSEGNVQDTTVVDRYGDPDLMAEFAEEYLRQFRTLMPTGRLPGNLKEVMPALLLLVTVTARARILLKSDDAWAAPRVAEALDVALGTVYRVKQRFAGEGLDGALWDRPQANRRRKLDDRGEAHLIALACSPPPEGHDHWTLRLLAGQVVELGLAPSMSHEGVRKRLKKTPSSRGRRRSGASPR